jgi:hypothetical protein
MPLMLKRPGSLDEDSWVAIDGHAGRLERAQRDDDLSLVIGSAKDLGSRTARGLPFQALVAASMAMV